MRRRKTAALLVLTALLAAGFLLWGNCSLQTTETALVSPALPPAFDGLRIVELADLHGRVFGRGSRRLLAAVRRAEPDLICIDGDLFDEHTDLAMLPPLLRGIFRADALFPDGLKYVVNGVVTWGYVLPFLLANCLANIYGYFINMKTTFRGKGTRAGFAVYLAILFALILFATWMQGETVAAMASSRIAPLSRTLASFGAGVVQTAVLFPLEKLVLFRQRPDDGKETT